MHPLPMNLREALQGALRSISFPKGHALVQALTAAHHAYFLQNGFAVAFRYQGNKRVVTHFWQAGEIILSPQSFFEQLPTDEIIQLTADSDLLALSFTAFQELSDEFPVMNHLVRDITAAYYARCEQRIIDLHTTSTWERYLKLLATYEHIEQYVSQEVIASYLNITPQSLSRLKASHG